MEKNQQPSSIGYFVVAFLLIMAMQNFLFGPHAENLAYSEFLDRGAHELLATKALGEDDLRRLRQPAEENIAAAPATERWPS